MTGLKLVEAGLPSEKIALMALPMVPIQVTLPWIIRYLIDQPILNELHMILGMCSQFTVGPRPLDVFTRAYIPRVLMGLLFAALVWWTARVGINGEFPFYYYIIIIGVFIVHQVCCSCHTLLCITSHLLSCLLITLITGVCILHVCVSDGIPC